jgi:hypothetical protein
VLVRLAPDFILSRAAPRRSVSPRPYRKAPRSTSPSWSRQAEQCGAKGAVADREVSVAADEEGEDDESESGSEGGGDDYSIDDE